MTRDQFDQFDQFALVLIEHLTDDERAELMAVVRSHSVALWNALSGRAMFGSPREVAVLMLNVARWVADTQRDVS